MLNDANYCQQMTDLCEINYWMLTVIYNYTLIYLYKESSKNI